MTERAYTVAEIDRLREVLDMRYLYGTSNLKMINGCSRTCRPEEKAAIVEQQLRTYMLAGITAEDIEKADGE